MRLNLRDFSAIVAALFCSCALAAGAVADDIELTPLVVDVLSTPTPVKGSDSRYHLVYELRHPIRRLEYGARLMKRALQGGPAAILFGSEKFGLSNADFSHCNWLMRIPTVSQDLSMNLGQAVALCLYELSREPKAANAHPEKIRRANAAENQQITAQLLEALRHSGYINPVTAASTEEKVRRLVLRLDIAARDVPVLLGMLRQILWKLHDK